MKETNNTASALDTDIPESVRVLVDLILGVVVDFEQEEIDYEDSFELIQNQEALVGIVTMEMHDVEFPDSVRFIEKAKIVSGLFSSGYQTVFEYDKWYINPSYLFDRKPIRDSVFVKKGNKPFVTLWNEPVASVLVDCFGMCAECYVGVDFTSEKWIKRLTKKNSIYSLIIRFLWKEISDEDMDELPEYDDSLLFDSSDEMDRYSLRVANFLAKTIMNIVLSSDAMDECIDVFSEIIISRGPSKMGINEYWIEFGEYYLIGNDVLDCGVLMGLLEDFKHDKELSFTVQDVFNTNIIFQEEIQKALRDVMN